MAVALALCAVMVGAGCGPSSEEVRLRHQNEELQGQLTSANNHGAELQHQLDTMSAQNSAMAQRLQALGENVTGLQQNLNDTTRALEELRSRERQAQARLDAFRQMIERFRAMIQAGRLRVRIVRNRMVVELPENILFESGDARIKDEGRTALTDVVNVLKQIPNREFQVTGHTDNVPIHSHHFPSNWELSSERAVNVVRFMITQGMDANRLSAAGAADTAPVASNDAPEGRAQNRRIEIALLPNLDELPDLSSLESVTGDNAAPAPPAGGAGH